MGFRCCILNSVIPITVTVVLLYCTEAEASVDLTTTEKATGANVVRAAIAKLDNAFDGIEQSQRFWTVEHSTFFTNIGLCRDQRWRRPKHFC